MLLHDLDSLLVFLTLGSFLQLLSLHVLVRLHVRVEDHPLSGFETVSGSLGWVSFETFLSDGHVESLRASSLVVELVPQRLLGGMLVILHYIRVRFTNIDTYEDLHLPCC